MAGATVKFCCDVCSILPYGILCQALAASLTCAIWRNTSHHKSVAVEIEGFPNPHHLHIMLRKLHPRRAVVALILIKGVDLLILG